MTKNENQNEIIAKVITPLMAAALKQNVSEQKYKAKEIEVEEMEAPLQDIVDTFDINKMKEVVACIQWYEDHMKSILNYIKKPMEVFLGSLSDDEYKDEVDSELVNASYVIKPSTSYSSNTSSHTPLWIKKTYAISDEVMPTRINPTQMAKAIKIGETSVMDAIKAGDIIVDTTFKRSLASVKLKETKEINE